MNDSNVGISFILVVLFFTIMLMAAFHEKDYWKDRYVQKHCVAWESTGSATKRCACLDDEPCVKTQEVKP